MLAKLGRHRLSGGVAGSFQRRLAVHRRVLSTTLVGGDARTSKPGQQTALPGSPILRDFTQAGALVLVGGLGRRAEHPPAWRSEPAPHAGRSRSCQAADKGRAGSSVCRAGRSIWPAAAGRPAAAGPRLRPGHGLPSRPLRSRGSGPARCWPRPFAQAGGRATGSPPKPRRRSPACQACCPYSAPAYCLEKDGWRPFQKGCPSSRFPMFRRPLQRRLLSFLLAAGKRR